MPGCGRGLRAAALALFLALLGLGTADGFFVTTRHPRSGSERGTPGAAWHR